MQRYKITDDEDKISIESHYEKDLNSDVKQT